VTGIYCLNYRLFIKVWADTTLLFFNNIDLASKQHVFCQDKIVLESDWKF
jgi:hypothetical protein